MDEPLIRAWEKTVDVQQHFNDLCLRVRNFAVTVTTAVLGGTLLAFREAPHAAIWILGAGLVSWLLFYMMDAAWYHQLLLGSVAHGEKIEEALVSKGIIGFDLAKSIREKSGVKLLYWEWRSKGRLHSFYIGGMALFLLLGFGAWATLSVAKQEGKHVRQESTTLSDRPAMLFPPHGAQLQIEGSYHLAFGWDLVKSAKSYRLEVQDEKGLEIFSVILPRSRGSFVADATMLETKELSGQLRWRATPLNAFGNPTHEVSWCTISVKTE